MGKHQPPSRPFNTDHRPRPRFPINASSNQSATAVRHARETKERLDQALRDLIGYTRHYVRCQLTLWKQVPWWALQAEALDGDDPRLIDAFNDEIWWVYVANGKLAIDLRTGQITTEMSAFGDRSAAGDDDVLRLAPHLNQLDGHAILLDLKARAEENANHSNQSRTDEWRAKTRAELGLTPPNEDE